MMGRAPLTGLSAILLLLAVLPGTLGFYPHSRDLQQASPKPPPPTPCPPNLKFCGDPDGATGECCTATQTCVTSLGIAQPILRCCPTSQRSGFECVGLDGESSWCCGNEECVTSSDGLSKRCRLKRPSPPRPRRPPPPPRTPTCPRLPLTPGVTATYLFNGKPVLSGGLRVGTKVVLACSRSGWRLYVGNTWQRRGTFNRTCSPASVRGDDPVWRPRAALVTCRAPPGPPKPPPPPRCPRNQTYCSADRSGGVFACCTASQSCVASKGLFEPVKRCCPRGDPGYACNGDQGEESTWCCGNEECVTATDGLRKTCRPRGTFKCGETAVCLPGQKCELEAKCGDGLCCNADQVTCGTRCCPKGNTCRLTQLQSYPCARGTCVAPSG